MRNHPFIVLAALLFLSLPKVAWAIPSISSSDENDFLHKMAKSSRLDLRFGTGYFKGFLDKNDMQYSYIYPDFAFNYYVHPRWSVGTGFDFHFISAASNLDYWGMRMMTRLYLIGQGMPVTGENIGPINVEHWKKYSIYVGGEFKRLNYSVPMDPTTVVADLKTNGTVFNVNIFIGYEYRFTEKFNFNFEFNYTTQSLSETDVRIRPYSRLILYGIGIIW